MMAGASAPSPFYPVLQRDIGFSSATLTGIFAVYAVALLLTLLVTGSLSDHLGRRPVVSGALALLAVSMLAFWHADSVTLLVTARIVQGVASGLLLSSLTATVVDLEPRPPRSRRHRQQRHAPGWPRARRAGRRRRHRRC